MKKLIHLLKIFLPEQIPSIKLKFKTQKLLQLTDVKNGIYQNSMQIALQLALGFLEVVVVVHLIMGIYNSSLLFVLGKLFELYHQMI